MIKKIVSFVLFILPWTKSKVEEAQIILEGVDGALNILQEQQNTAVTGINDTIENLMEKKGQALKEIEKANAIREQIVNTMK